MNVSVYSFKNAKLIEFINEALCEASFALNKAARWNGKNAHKAILIVCLFVVVKQKKVKKNDRISVK